ncbi:MAG TPA: putative baseplate assembly protein [Anaerolineales bacterium]|nr:putative baseplate assembly protein [Anaerolineales bacterium]
MPLESEASRLMDPRRFDELRDAALLRIPRYTPEWTDFNKSDPGVTLVELFAWLTDLMLYQMNRIPDLSYVRFLQLLGLELLPAQPAVAYLTFTPQPGTQPPSVLERAQFSAQGKNGESLIFEALEGLSVIPMPLDRVQVFNGSSFEDLTNTNLLTGSSFRPFGWTPQVGSALYLGFTPPPQVPSPTPRLFPQDMQLRIFLPLKEQAGEPVACNDMKARPVPPVRLVWEYPVRDKPRLWRTLRTFSDESIAFTREGTIIVEGPGSDIVKTKEGRAQDQDRFWVRVRLEDRVYPSGQVPEIAFLRANVAKVENLTTVRRELLPVSDGLPNIRRTLRYTPVQANSLDLRLADPSGSEEKWERDDTKWKRIEDLLRCEPDDACYELNPATGEIQFGDGIHGRIPPASIEIMAYSYKAGGGVAGNVPIGAISAARVPIIGVAGIRNERPATGGQQEQSYDNFKTVAPARLRCNNQAVSAADYESLARSAGGIAQAKALPLVHPDYPGVEVPGAVTVVVVPDTEEIPPRASQEQLESVCRYLDQYRLLTTELYVREPEYLEVKVEARIAANPYAAFDAVARHVNEEINRYLDPRRKEGTDFGSDFGLDLIPTNLYSVIRSVADVQQVSHLALTVRGSPHEPVYKTYTVRSYQMVYGVAQHDIKVEPFVDRT